MFQFVVDHVGEFHELGDGELLGPTGHDIMLEEGWTGRMLTVEDLAQGDAQHLAALVEGGLHHAAEELLVATEAANSVARHADDGTLHLGRGIEDRWPLCC